MLPAATLQVAEACSGIRSLVSLLTLGLVYGYFADGRFVVRLALAAVAVPIAIFVNGLRVAVAGAAAHLAGPEAATGLIHTGWGAVTFVASFGLLILANAVLQRALPARPS